MECFETHADRSFQGHSRQMQAGSGFYDVQVYFLQKMKRKFLCTLNAQSASAIGILQYYFPIYQ